MRRLFAGGLIVVALFGALTVPTAASADTGDRTTVTNCGAFQAPESGTAHARIRNCTITWAKNIIDGAYWQTVRYQLLDSYTDGYCARGIVEQYRGSGSYSSVNFSECNGVWTTKSKTFSGRAQSMWFALGYGPGPYELFGTNIREYSAPGGY